MYINQNVLGYLIVRKFCMGFVNKINNRDDTVNLSDSKQTVVVSSVVYP